MSETPHLDAAVRAGCSPWHDEDCTYPACDCAPVVPDMIRTALRAAFPWTPSPETIEAMARELYREGYRPHEELSDLNIEATFSATEHDGDCTKKCYTCLLCEAEPARRQALAAYRRIPIVRELWPDLAGAEPPGDV